MVCSCLIEISAFVDKTFDYIVPDSLKSKLKRGMRVTLPFSSRMVEGFVLDIFEREDVNGLKEVSDINDDFPVLNEELLLLGKTIKDTTLCTLIVAYQSMLPLALKAKKKINISIKYDKYYKLNENIDLDVLKLNENSKKIINILKEKIEVKEEVLKNISSSTVITLLKKNVIILEKKEKYRLERNANNKSSFSLNEQQKKVYDEVISSLNSQITYLLYGITGSGKTNVYMEIIDKVISLGKKALVLVPEISLTPQIISRFSSKFDKIALLHSSLSDGEKYDEWRKINEDKVDIVIGARSAVFAPLKNIGIIIIDEEHSQTYKQDNNPRYFATNIAIERSKYHKCPLILGSATPRLESYARSQKGVFKLLVLDKRYNKRDLPKTKLIDMNVEFKRSNGYFSNELINAIKDRIYKKEQIILFLNRRGYSSNLTCTGCGDVMKCPSCDISLTFHKSSNMLRCHYCGYATKKEDKCPKCGEVYKDFGLGTEKVEEQLFKIEGAKVIRMDVDTTSKKNSHERIINSFLNEEYNILLGTQMIAKGLDFPNVTLVGIINADISLNFPDFRSSEITFQILNQVAGRSGRGEKEGEVLIQTFNPDHYALRYAKEGNYIRFYEEEMSIRKKLGYPPYYYICFIKIVSLDYEIASKEASKIAKFLKENIQNEIILGPSLCNIFKINNKYNFSVIIKYKNINNIKSKLSELSNHYFLNKNVKLEITVDY